MFMNEMSEYMWYKVNKNDSKLLDTLPNILNISVKCESEHLISKLKLFYGQLYLSVSPNVIKTRAKHIEIAAETKSPTE